MAVATETFEAEAGERVASARRASGMTRADLAGRLGISLWALEQVETGAADPRPLIGGIAGHTGHPPEYFAPRRRRTQEAGRVYVERTREQERAEEELVPRRLLVIGSLTLLLTIRLTSETFHLLPSVVKFADIPIFFVLVLASMAFRSEERIPPPLQLMSVLAVIFAGICAVSILFNLSRIEAAPAVTFLYMFLSPIGVGVAVFRLWPPGNAPFVTRWMVALGLLQLPVVLLVDLPHFVSSNNPDDFSGTFGDNGYQLAIYLFVVITALAGVLTYDKERPIAKLAVPAIIAFALVIFFVQYRTLLITLFLSLLLIGYFMRGRTRGVLVGVVVGVALLGSLYYVSTQFTGLKYDSAGTTLRDKPLVLIDARLAVIGDVINLFGDNPRYTLTGTGPGTFSSRAWRTFSILENPRKAFQTSYTKRLTGGEYRTDVSDKYTVPRARAEVTIDGSTQLTQPYSSYTGVAAEIGLGGLLLILAIYLVAFFWAARMTSHAILDRLRSDPVVPLCLSAVIALFILIQLGMLENWLEVTRISFLVWALLAISAKEIAARNNAT
jgi:transcriptional regulator with XRE-family HTH domain